MMMRKGADHSISIAFATCLDFNTAHLQNTKTSRDIMHKECSAALLVTHERTQTNSPIRIFLRF